MPHRLGQIVSGLKPIPSFNPAPEGFIQPNGHFRRNTRVAIHEIGELLATDAEVFGGFRYDQAQRRKAIFPNRAAGMGWVF
jgi:hypothetical protein